MHEIGCGQFKLLYGNQFPDASNSVEASDLEGRGAGAIERHSVVRATATHKRVQAHGKLQLRAADGAGEARASGAEIRDGYAARLVREAAAREQGHGGTGPLAGRQNEGRHQRRDLPRRSIQIRCILKVFVIDWKPYRACTVAGRER